MQLVDQAGAKILPNRRYAATDADVAAARGGPGLLQGSVDAFGDEVDLRAPRDRERGPGVARQHENGSVIGRLVAPPPLPTLVRPRASKRTEHIASKNPGADPGKALFRH